MTPLCEKHFRYPDAIGETFYQIHGLHYEWKWRERITGTTLTHMSMTLIENNWSWLA